MIAASGARPLMRPLPRFVIEAINMRIPHDLRKCVVYVGIEASGRFVPIGTGFIVSFEPVQDMCFAFVLTAKHVIDQIDCDSFAVRLNRLTGHAESIIISKRNVFEHEQTKNDIALCGINLGADVYDFRLISLDRARLERQRQGPYAPEVGDEVVAVGLYTSHYGLTKNIPVARVGNLALLPGEPVRGARGEYVEAYLIELRTIAGLSGSPVFINPPRVWTVGNDIKIRRGEIYLPLGILIGYHVVESSEDQVLVPKTQSDSDRHREEQYEGTDQRNTGFGIVMPFERAIEIVEREDVLKRIVEDLEEAIRGSGFRFAGRNADE